MARLDKCVFPTLEQVVSYQLSLPSSANCFLFLLSFFYVFLASRGLSFRIHFVSNLQDFCVTDEVFFSEFHTFFF